MNPARQYLESKVNTASQDELFLMLFDGALRFCEQAKEKFSDPDPEPSAAFLIRAQKIVLELVSYHRKEDMPPEIFKAVADLYDFVFNRLVRGNLDRRLDYVEEARKVLSHLRDTFAGAMERNREERFPMVKALKDAAQVAGSAVSFEG